MKTLYCLKCHTMNGTVTMNTEVTIYPTKELAEEVQKVVEKKYNESNVSGFGLYTKVEKVNMYESLDEVPIIKKDLNNE